MAIGEGFFTGMIDEKGDILVVSGTREYKKVGIDSRREQELIQEISERDETLEAWRNVLIENGLLKIPKTAEEIAEEAAREQMRLMQERNEQQIEINTVLLESVQKSNQTISALETIVKELVERESKGYSGIDVERDNHSDVIGKSTSEPRNAVKSNGTKPATNTVSNRKSAKTTA